MATLAARNTERQFIVEVIKLYRGLPCLWNGKSKEYFDRERKKKGYNLLLSKYRERFPEATREDLKKKLNVLRTNYRKELKKYLHAMEAGERFKPKLWYFNEMEFLHDENAQDESEYSILDTHSFTDEDELNFQEIPAKRAKPDEPMVELEFHSVEDKDEFYHWAMSCAADLRKMEKTQQLFAKKAFADILLEGQLGLLHRHSVIINENTSMKCNGPPSSPN